MKKRIVSTTMAVLTGLGLMGALAACNQVATADVGACLQYSDLQSQITDIPTVDCSKDHDAQVVGKFDMDDGDYPGSDAISDAAADGCREQFQDFIGLSFDDSSLQMTFVGPSEDTWNQANDREIICFAFLDDGTTTTGSWEGAAI